MAPKLNACQPCTARKRRCDKAQPVCSRCSEDELQCSYSSRKRRRIQAPAHELSQTLSESDDSALSPTPRASDALLEGWTGWTGAVFDDNLEASLIQIASPSRSLAAHAWFLHPSSWTIANIEITTPPFALSVYANNIRGLHDWFSQWLTQGQNPFLHRQLYAEAVVPQSIRDAFASVAVHTTKTPESEVIADVILEGNLSALLASQPPNDDCLSTRGHLARTQALFIHLVLGLFSSSIPRRANSEHHVRTLLRWVQQLWGAATSDPDLCRNMPHPTPDDMVTDAAFDGDPAPRLWRTWVLAESIRRVWLLTSVTMSTYLVMKHQWSKCHGGVQFTARGSLWAAESAGAWMEACKEDPLFLLNLHGDHLFSTATWDEVDEMARHLLTAMWGRERVESWQARTRRRTAAKVVQG